jgi:translation initiation factor 1
VSTREYFSVKLVSAVATDTKEGLGSVSGLPDERGIDADLGRAQQRLTVRHDTRRYGKSVTVVEGFDPDVTDLGSVASELKRRLAVGGSVVDDCVERPVRHDTRLRWALDVRAPRDSRPLPSTGSV